MSEQMCRFCQRYVKLAYYCEECGSTCCSDCLHEKKVDFYTCQECNSSIDSDKRKCECGNEEFWYFGEYVRCPKCATEYKQEVMVRSTGFWPWSKVTAFHETWMRRFNLKENNFGNWEKYNIKK